jgi:hypothetical protein
MGFIKYLIDKVVYLPLYNSSMSIFCCNQVGGKPLIDFPPTRLWNVFLSLLTSGPIPQIYEMNFNIQLRQQYDDKRPNNSQ